MTMQKIVKIGGKMSLSVIIPVYNVEEFIAPCLESINNALSFIAHKEAVEILIINDGSTDNSGVLAQRFCERNARFTYYSKPNGGLSDARNYGLSKRKNDYVCFIDSDDLISEEYFSSIINLLNQNIDLVIFDVEDIYPNGTTKVMKGMDIENELWTVIPSAWNKVYHHKLFQNIQFPTGKWYEDVGTTYKAIKLVETYIYVEKPLYKYRKNREGSILSTSTNKINDIYDVLDDVYIYYEKNAALNEKNTEGLTYQYVKLLLWSNMYRQLKYCRFDLLSFTNKMAYTRNLIYTKFPDWKENKFLLHNEIYFVKRLGENYIKSIDHLGKNRFFTMLSLFKIIHLNKKQLKKL